MTNQKIITIYANDSYEFIIPDGWEFVALVTETLDYAGRPIIQIVVRKTSDKND